MIVPFNGDWSTEDFPANEIFNCKTWRETHANFIREDEMVDPAMNKVAKFPFDPKFTLAIVSQIETFEEL